MTPAPAPTRYGATLFDTGIRQLRLAVGMLSGRRLNPGNIGRLVDDALATLAEFEDDHSPQDRSSIRAYSPEE